MYDGGSAQRDGYLQGERVLDITRWFTFLVTAIYSGQVLSHHKGGSYDVVFYSCWSEPVKLEIVSLTGTVQMHFINTLTAGLPGDMRLSAYISLACWHGSQR